LIGGCAGGGSTLTGEALRVRHEELTVDLPVRHGRWTIPVYRSGDPAGRSVIFVHGTPGSAGAWRRYLKNPIEGFEMVALDRPGFGESTPHRAAPALADQARAIEPLLSDAPGSGLKPILVGHSLGGPIIARVAAEHPDRVGGLVIVAGSLDPSLEHVLPVQRVGAMFPFSSLLPASLRIANRELIPLKRELTELGGMLDRVTCPVIIVHATDDRLVPYANVAYMVDRFVNAASVEVMTFGEGDHFLPWNHEPAVREAIVRAAALAHARGPAGSRRGVDQAPVGAGVGSTGG